MDPLPVPYTCSRLPTLCNYVSLLQDRFKVTLHYGGVLILPTADANVLLYRISQNKWFERGWLYAQKLNRKGEKGFCCLRLRFWANEIWKWLEKINYLWEVWEEEKNWMWNRNFLKDLYEIVKNLFIGKN